MHMPMHTDLRTHMCTHVDWLTKEEVGGVMV